MKNDKYKVARGGWSTILDIFCDHCGNLVCQYQKDGPGLLKRMYIDRMSVDEQPGAELICKSCGRVLGTKNNYEKENRQAYRLYVGAVTETIVEEEKK